MLIFQYADPETSNDFLHRLNGSRHFLYAVIILSAFTVILTTGFACLLIAFLHQKHQLNASVSKQLLNSENSNSTYPLRACEDDTRFCHSSNNHLCIPKMLKLSLLSDNFRYDVPWEQMQVPTICRRSPYRNFNNRNGFTPMSPSPMGPIADVMRLAQSDCRKTSPSSSFGTELLDSGLESV